MADSGIPLGQWSGSDATEALHKTITTFVHQSDKQAATMIRLTQVLTFLTVVMLAAVLVQVYLIWPSR